MARDIRVENRLAQASVVYEYRVSVPVKSIHRDVVRSKFQARITGTPLNSDTVELYAQAMVNGADFPAPVLASRTDGTYDILGGFHRVNARTRAGSVNTDAYVVKVDVKTGDLLARTLNTVEAVAGAGKAERVAQATRLIKLHGYSCRAAAKECGISESLLEQELRAAATQERLAGKVDASQLTTSHLAEMAGIQNDNVLEAVATIAARGKLSAVMLRPVISEIRTARTEQAQLDVVNSFGTTPVVRERLDLAKAGRLRMFNTKRRSSRMFASLTSAINHITRYPSIADMALTDSDLAGLIKTWGTLQEKMGKFLATPSIARSDNGETPNAVDAATKVVAR